jgi:hypothetical protein
VGQINAVVGQGSQPVAVVFTTDDTRLATVLQVTSDLTTLPAGWSSASPSFACTLVSTGSTCQLNLSYTPTAYTTPGTLVVGYSYKNNAGQTKTGTVSIPYRATTNDTIAATPSQPSLAVIIGSPTVATPVMITFATDDGNPAVGVPATANALTVTSGLNPLPTGWSASATTFSCLTVSDGTACQLPLSYAPSVVTTGVQTLTLGYSYVNDAGLANTGTATVGYSAASNNTVNAAASPASPVSFAIGTSNPVTVSFTTSDGNPASLISIPSLSLPAGWSGPPSFTCATVTGSVPSCPLTLTYAPTLSSGNGNLLLGFSYKNNAGLAGSGTLTIQYSGT